MGVLNRAVQNVRKCWVKVEAAEQMVNIICHLHEIEPKSVPIWTTSRFAT